MAACPMYGQQHVNNTCNTLRGTPVLPYLYTGSVNEGGLPAALDLVQAAGLELMLGTAVGHNGYVAPGL